MRPVFGAGANRGAVEIVDRQILVDCQRQCDSDRRRPHGADDNETAGRRQPRTQWVNDGEVSVNSDRHRRQSRHVHADGHYHRNHVTQRLRNEAATLATPVREFG